MPRNRTAKSAVLGLGVRRPAPRPFPSRSRSALRRRIVLGTLVLLSLALITASFRERPDGPLHDAQGAVAGALQPLEVAAERVARPFRDAYGWTKDLFNARSENEKLRAENERLKQQVIQNESALQENVRLKSLLHYRNSPAFPQEYDGVAAEVISQPSRAFDQTIVVSAGSDDGVTVDAPGRDRATGSSARSRGSRRTRRACACSPTSRARSRHSTCGRARPGSSSTASPATRSSSAGSRRRRSCTRATRSSPPATRSGELASRYPKGITIGHVTFVGQLNTDLYLQVLVVSDVDFSALDSVLVLVSRRPLPELP